MSGSWRSGTPAICRWPTRPVGRYWRIFIATSPSTIWQWYRSICTFRLGAPIGLHDAVRVVLPVQKEAGNVARVDRFDQHVAPGARGLPRGPRQVAIGRWPPARRTLDARRAPGPPSRARAGSPAPGHIDSAWSMPRRNSSSRPGRQAMPRSPASQSPGGALNSTCCRPWSASRAPATRRLVGVGEQVLDRLEAVGRRRGKAVEEVVLRVEHAEVGGEAGHGRAFVGLTSARRSALRNSSICSAVSGARAAPSATAARFLPVLRAPRWLRPACVPDVRAEPRRASPRGSACRASRIAAMRLRHCIGHRRVAGAVVADQRHVADLHHEVRRDRRHDVVARSTRRPASAPPGAWHGCG